MREKMSNEERNYIQTFILGPLSKDLEKVNLFGNSERANLMLKNAINALPYEKDKFEIKLQLHENGFCISSCPVGCQESLNICLVFK